MYLISTPMCLMFPYETILLRHAMNVNRYNRTLFTYFYETFIE